MKTNQLAFTRVDAVAGVAALLILLVLYLLFGRSTSFGVNHEPLRRIKCTEHLKELGKATAAYREDNGAYFPFSWQRAGDRKPDGIGAAQAAMAATALGNLYPRYVQTGNLFSCPSTAVDPSFALNVPLEYRSLNAASGLPGVPPAGSNWTLINVNHYDPSSPACSYGYDPRISPGAVANRAVMADMDGSWRVNPDTSNQNHSDGQNVLYADAHVAWQKTNFCSTDPHDNIFSEDAWDADTDTYLLSKDAGLGISFDGYRHLQHPTR